MGNSKIGKIFQLFFFHRQYFHCCFATYGCLSLRLQVYKILSGKRDTIVAPVLTISDTSVTRGNKYKLYKYSFCHVWKFSFTC